MRLPAILNEAAAVLGLVSVVQMASDTSANERAEERRCRASSGTARRILSSASGTPMTPVEQTKTSSGLQPSRFAASATVRTAAAWPAAPVAQLALPAFTTTARMRPLDARKCSLEIRTGATLPKVRAALPAESWPGRDAHGRDLRSSAPFVPLAPFANDAPCKSAR